MPEVCLVGKGITFDSGGISLKSDQAGMMSMKSDMGGAAVTMATILGAAKQIVVILTKKSGNNWSFPSLCERP